MPERTKLKILYIYEIIRRTDADHSLTSVQIVDKLKSEYGISAERKGVIRDLRALEDAGYSIKLNEDLNKGWYMADQNFEDYELKMLCDAAASAKFLDLNDSRNLIKKLCSLATISGEEFIKDTLVIDPAIKISDSKYKIKFDTVMRAVKEHRRIRFHYAELVSGNKKVLKREGKIYEASPYYIVPLYEEYFVICNTAPHDNASQYRIEMMQDIEILKDEPVRDINEVAGLQDIGTTRTIGDYLRSTIDMWSGPLTDVTLLCDNGCRHDILMKFGKDVMMIDKPDDKFLVNIKVAGTHGLFHWLAAYGTYIKIISPDEVREGYCDYIKSVLEQYII